MVLTLLLLLAAQAGPATLPEMLSRAMQSLEASDRVSARRELTEALRLYPASPAVHNFLGVVEAGEGNYLAAEKRFREAVLRAPDYTDAYLNLGRLYQENGAKDPKAATKALAAYQAILRYEPDHSEARFQSAALLQAMGEFGRSLDELRRLPPPTRSVRRPSPCAWPTTPGRGERAEADAAAEKLLGQGGFDELDVRPTLPVLLAPRTGGSGGEAPRGSALAGAGLVRRPAAARPAEGEGRDSSRRPGYVSKRPRGTGRTACPCSSTSPAWRTRRGTVRARSATSPTPAPSSPANARVHFLFGMICVELDLGAEAYNSLKEAVRLDPENAAANYAMGAVALHRKDPSEAIPYFRKYAELEPEEPRGPFAIGVAAFQAKDYETARRLLVPAAEPAGDGRRGQLLSRPDGPRGGRVRGGAAFRPAVRRGEPLLRRPLVRAGSPVPATWTAGEGRRGARALPEARSGALSRQPAPRDALRADAGPPRAGAAAALRRDQEAGSREGGGLPPADRGRPLLQSPAGRSRRTGRRVRRRPPRAAGRGGR